MGIRRSFQPGEIGHASHVVPPAANRAARRYGQRVAKERAYTRSHIGWWQTGNKTSRSTGNYLSPLERVENPRYGRSMPFYQHTPTGLYVRHHATVIDTGTNFTGEVQYSVPGTGHLATIKRDSLQPAHPSVDLPAAMQHNRSLLARSRGINLDQRLKEGVDYLLRGVPVAEVVEWVMR